MSVRAPNSRSNYNASVDRLLHGQTPEFSGLGIYWSFVRSVFVGGFVAWLLFMTLIWAGGSATETVLPLSASLIVLTGFFGFVYCTIVILAFFFVPFLVVRLARKFPDSARRVTMLIAAVSSLAMWLFIAWLIDLRYSGTGSFIAWTGLVASLAGGITAGHLFWKRVFPPLGDVSEVFQ